MCWACLTNNHCYILISHQIHVCNVDDYSWENTVGLNWACIENTTSFIRNYNFPSKIGSSHTIISHCHYQFSSNCYTPMWHTTTSGGKLLTCWIMYRVDRPTDTYERGFFHCLWWFATSLVCTDFISILCTKISI